MTPTFPVDFTGREESRKFLRSQMTRKSRKHSKGCSASSVPEYGRDVVEDGMSVSEGVNYLKRKSVSSNVDDYDRFDVPLRVLSLSNMSSRQKKDLAAMLKLELEQVRALQKKISLSSVVSAPQGKKPASPGRNGARNEESKIGYFEPQKRAVPATFENDVLMKQCETLLKRLMGHKFSLGFNTPVDVVKLNIPDYFTIIKHPMDLGTVKSNLSTGRYSSPLEFAADVRLTFLNSMEYNPPGNNYHFMAKTLAKFFEGRWKAIEKKIPVDGETHSAPARSGACIKTKIPSQNPPLKKNIMPGINRVKPLPPKLIMTNEEKRILGLDLEALLGEPPKSIVDFLKEHISIAGQDSEEELEIDMDALSNETLFKLRKLLDDCLLEKRTSKSKAEPCEMELCNESGLSTLSLQPHKGNDAPVDEDVDIMGEDDPPISSYSPVEIVKDTKYGNSKCSISSSSGRDSSSSSSDSDSSSSSGSESDGDEATVLEENLDAGANLQKKQSIINGADMEDKCTNGVSEIEQNTRSNPHSAKVDDNQDGGSAPSKKFYRTATLINRFADTILKAHEKTLEKGEKRDLEKLRREKGELERNQREEKARLQAEAKKADEARKKAQLKAVAEARRKRELEREAARQKLLEMEKAVEINENIQFLKDLEMLSATTNGEGLPNLTEEGSPCHSEEIVGSLKLQGSSNPLEQLGLYMKVDDEYDEDEPDRSVEEPSDDVEEGEIDIIN